AVVMAVSAGGLVELSADGEQWNKELGQVSMRDSVRITPDLEKLDLSVKRILNLEELSAVDSGRTVGPKAAKLAELRKHYPEAVSRGLTIPFGLFREIALGQPHGSDGTLYDWMRSGYAELDAMPQGTERAQATEAFRRELYNAVLSTVLPREFVAQLHKQFLAMFGDEDAGVFVRSDTNVEDLAGFTGAGLNLTLPNVVGLADLVDAIPRVWASPFTRRAFSWRQSHMAAPEHVYTSILLLESVASEKSGVMVTADIDSGARDVISVAVNEGLGGAVDGQAAESLRVNLENGDVRVLATATAPWRRTTNPEGGILKLPASGSDTVLQPAEIRILRQFAADLPERFPPIVDEAGAPAPADVEFGFLHGQLHLFQLRPFLDSKAARTSKYLQDMDSAGVHRQAVSVDMQSRPAL
ncbi:MAG: PEP/pyruvate-binding domain-containing protein, partial [Halieaceae bacterium]